MDLHIVILAAGKGTRMKSDVPKVLHQIAGRALIDRVLDTAAALEPHDDDARRGPRRRPGARASGTALTVCSSSCRSRSSAPATRCCRRRRCCADSRGPSCCCRATCHSSPARALRGPRCRRTSEAGAVATVLTAIVERPYGYGRIVRSQGRITRIVEERDASAAQRTIKEINSGIYAFELAPLFDALDKSGRTTRKASITCPISSPSTADGGGS